VKNPLVPSDKFVTLTSEGNKMGILEKIRRNIRRTSSTRGSKETLSISSTCDETFYIGDTNEDTYVLFSGEPRSPHNGAITTTSIPKSIKQKKFFDDNESSNRNNLQSPNGHFRREEPGEPYCEYNSSDEERDDIRLLGSTNSNSIRSSAYSFDPYEEETIFEPSFEVALMDPETLLLDSPKAEVMPDGENPAKPTVPQSVSAENLQHPVPLPQRKPKAQKRYDLYGRPFVHIFHEGLATLYEDPDDVGALVAAPPISTRSKIASGKQRVPDDIKIRARWELALEQTSRVGACDWDGILSPRFGMRSASEI
jgi:hypothetical protein